MDEKGALCSLYLNANGGWNKILIFIPASVNEVAL